MQIFSHLMSKASAIRPEPIHNYNSMAQQYIPQTQHAAQTSLKQVLEDMETVYRAITNADEPAKKSKRR